MLHQLSWVILSAVQDEEKQSQAVLDAEYCYTEAG